MTYSVALAKRVKAYLSKEHRVVEREMFGGVAFMVRGHMCCGVQGDEVMARVGRDRYAEALKWAGARPMDFTGKPMRGFVYVALRGLKSQAQLRRCVGAAVDFALAPPAKRQRAKRAASKRAPDGGRMRPNQRMQLAGVHK